MQFTVNLSMVEAIFLLAAIGLVVRLIIWYANVNSDRELFKDFIGRVDRKFDGIGERLERFSDRLESFSKRLESFSKRQDYFSDCLEHFSERLERFGHGDLLDRDSPLQLTALGKEVATEINAAAIASTMVDQLQPQIAGKSPYRIQQLCFDWVTEDKLSDAEKRVVEDTAFNRGLTVPQVIEVIAIELRERLLA